MDHGLVAAVIWVFVGTATGAQRPRARVFAGKNDLGRYPLFERPLFVALHQSMQGTGIQPEEPFIQLIANQPLPIRYAANQGRRIFESFINQVWETPT